MLCRTLDGLRENIMVSKITKTLGRTVKQAYSDGKKVRQRRAGDAQILQEGVGKRRRDKEANAEPG